MVFYLQDQWQLFLKTLDKEKHFPFGIIFSLIILIGGIFYNIFPIYDGLGCPFKKITGIPCPTCGGIRLYHSVIKGDFYRAFLFNPLIFLSGVVIFILAIYDIFIFTGLIKKKKISFNLFRIILIISVLANWIYLIVAKI